MGIKKYKNETVCEFLVQHNLQREGNSADSGESSPRYSTKQKEPSFDLLGESRVKNTPKLVGTLQDGYKSPNNLYTQNGKKIS